MKVIGLTKNFIYIYSLGPRQSGAQSKFSALPFLFAEINCVHPKQSPLPLLCPIGLIWRGDEIGKEAERAERPQSNLSPLSPLPFCCLVGGPLLYQAFSAWPVWKKQLGTGGARAMKPYYFNHFCGRRVVRTGTQQPRAVIAFLWQWSLRKNAPVPQCTSPLLHFQRELSEHERWSSRMHGTSGR